jgi:hypothetical protein
MKNKPLLITTLGYPGSGKTYFSERLAKEFNLFHINSDKIRVEMFDNPNFSPEEHHAVFHFIEWLTQELLKKGVSVIVDANLNKQVRRDKFAQMAYKTKVDYILLYLKTPTHIAEDRIIKRRDIKNIEKKKYYRTIDLSVLHNIRKEIEYPTSKEHFLEIDGLKPYSKQVETFKNWLENK